MPSVCSDSSSGRRPQHRWLMRMSKMHSGRPNMSLVSPSLINIFCRWGVLPAVSLHKQYAKSKNKTPMSLLCQECNWIYLNGHYPISFLSHLRKKYIYHLITYHNRNNLWRNKPLRCYLGFIIKDFNSTCVAQTRAFAQSHARSWISTPTGLHHLSTRNYRNGNTIGQWCFKVASYNSNAM